MYKNQPNFVEKRIQNLEFSIESVLWLQEEN